MRRFGQVIGVDPTRIEEYAHHHDHIFPEVAQALIDAGVENYSIFVDPDLELLFAYFEYHGPDDEFEARMEAVAELSRRSGWWELVGAFQRPLESRSEGEWWKSLDEVFRLGANHR